MKYQFSEEQFTSGKMFDSRGKFYHKSGNRIKIFPFSTHPNSDPVLELEPLVGTYLCMLENKTAKELTASELSALLRDETEIEPGREDLFDEMVRHLFFTAKGIMRPLNLELLEQIASSEKSEIRIAEYLVDVLGEKDTLKTDIEKAAAIEQKTSNVLERLVLSKLQYEEHEDSGENLTYFRIVNSLNQPFEEDFAYILEDPKRAPEHLVSLLELYYFTYTAQACLQLNLFLDGKRDENIPLYFSVEWEKTSQSRLCFNQGWQMLQKAIEKIFAHVIVLELLNYTVPGTPLVDYIQLSEMVEDQAADIEIGKEIDKITEAYRNSINDCPEMNVLDKNVTAVGATDDALHYLFDCVRTQFENTVRERPYKSYAWKFENYCHKFLKSRGRSGLMLNLTEEMLIFITKLCIKNRDQMRLKDVFKEFEKRGIFLDNMSKEQVTAYYEKLNLIEKKSDSGDAKYVKRIL